MLSQYLGGKSMHKIVVNMKPAFNFHLINGKSKDPCQYLLNFSITY